MKRMTWLIGACLLSGLMTVGIVSELQEPAQAATFAVTFAAPSANPLDVVINEVAWAGHTGYANDEWIELYNNTNQDIDLTGWSVVAADGTPDISLSGIISAYGYFLLERSDESTVDNIPADLIYTGALENDPSAESLTLYDETNQIIDTVNNDGGNWPAGNDSTKCTMERIDPTAPDADANWASNDTMTRNGLDAGGAPINGTPKCRNSAASRAADLAVEKVAPAYAIAGERITYTIRLRNAGNVTATAVRLTDTLPAGVSFYTHTAPYTFTRPASHTLVWEVGFLPVSTALATFTVLADVNSGMSGAITNVITGATAITEAVTGNDAAQAATLVTQPQPDLSVVKSGPASVAVGDPITYRIVLSNPGQTPAAGVVVSDALPVGVSYSAENHPPSFTLISSGPTVVWTAAAVATNTTHVFTVTGLVADTASGPLVNHVSATTTSSETLTLNNTAAFTTAVVVAHDPLDVVINEVAWMGTDANANHEWIELYNTTEREIDLNDWELSDYNGTLAMLTGTIPANGYYLLASDSTTFSGADPAIDQLFAGNLRNNGETITLTNGSGKVIDTANAERGYDNGWAAGSNTIPKHTMERITPTALDADANWCTNDGVTRNGLDAGGAPINGTPKAQNSCYQPPPGPTADLTVTKTGPDTAAPGDLITYRIAVGNIGDLAAAGVRLTDTLPSAIISVAQTSPFTFSQLNHVLVWEIGDVLTGTQYPITVTGRLSDTAYGPLTNHVTAATTASETITANNHDACTTTVLIPGQADLVIAKAGPYLVTPGDPITYYIALSNTGSITATGVRVTDTLPAAVEFSAQVSEFAFDRSGRNLVWQLGDVPTGARHTITVAAQVAGTAVFTLTNQVTATTTASETVTYNNHAAWTTAVNTERAIYLPLVLRNYTPPPYSVIIEAVLYDGLQTSDYDEAVLLLNGGEDVDLSGWTLCKMGAADWDCADLPAVTIAHYQRLWLARSGAYFAASFGFEPDYVLAGWPALANAGDEVALRDAEGAVRDALVYKEGDTTIDGWDGAALRPYAGFAEAGQVLYRIPDEESGLPPADAAAAADWAQHTADPWQGQRVRYPGWDLELFFQPALGATGAVTVGITPDNAYQLVVDTIRSAEESIELEVYTLEHPGLVTELVQQAQQGVSVTMLLEGGPVGGVEDQELWACEQLHATGHGLCYFMVNTDTLKIFDRYTYVHAKFMVVDHERLLVGSQNLTLSSLPGDDKSNGSGGSRGVVLVTDAPEIVARAVEIFDADCDPDHHEDVSMWGPDNVLGYSSPPPGFAPATGSDWVTYTVRFSQTLATTGDWFELLTSPESALRNRDALLGLVARAGAGDGVYIEQLYEYPDWGDPTSAPSLRVEAYIAAARRGATVRILLNGGNFGIEQFSLTNNIEAAAYVNTIAQAEGLDMSAHLGDPTQYGIHNKMALVDLGAEGRYAHVGSINGSETSNKINREMALQVRSDDLFNYLYVMFDYDWNHQPPERHLLISEVLYDPAGTDTGQEWVELYNPTTENVDLSGWYLGDVGPGGEYGSGLYQFPAGSVLVAEGVIVIAHQAYDVTFAPDYEFLIDPNRDDPSVPNMVRAGSWDGFGFALGNTGDEVLLLDAAGAPVDVVVYGVGSYPGVTPHPGVSDQGHSLERRPPKQDTDDCSQDFYDRIPPTPGELPE